MEDFLATPLSEYPERWDVHDEHGDEIDFERLPGRLALAGEANPAPLLMQVVNRATGVRDWRLVKAAAHPRLRWAVVPGGQRHRGRHRSARPRAAQAFLVRASKLLGASLDPEQTLDNLAGAVVPDLADWCAVDMPDERGVLRRVATADRRAERTREASLVVRERSGEPALPVGPPQVMRSGRPEYYPQIDDALLKAAALDPAQLERLRAVGARSAIVVPMIAGPG